MPAEITGESPQAVAYKLFEIIAVKEGKILGNPGASPDKQWVLDTYRECIAAVLSEPRWGPYGN
jgi:hypothetical protein